MVVGVGPPPHIMLAIDDDDRECIFFSVETEEITSTSGPSEAILQRSRWDYRVEGVGIALNGLVFGDAGGV